MVGLAALHMRDAKGSMAWLAVFMMCCAPWAAACSELDATEGEAQPPEERAFDPFIEQVIESTRASGGSDEQLAILETARAAGEVTPQMLYEASQLAAGCFEDAGVEAWFEPAVPGDPLAGLGLTVVLDTDESQDLADACTALHYEGVSYGFGVQPVATEWADQRLLRATPQLVACIREHGATIADEPTADELRAALFMLRNGFEYGEEPVPGDAYEPVDCASAAGIAGY